MRSIFDLALFILPAGLLPLGCAGKTDTKAEAGSQTQTSSGRPMAERLEDGKGLEHVARVHRSLYRGAQPSTEGYRTLSRMGIKTVICLRKHSSFEKEVEIAGFRQGTGRVHQRWLGRQTQVGQDLDDDLGT